MEGISFSISLWKDNLIPALLPFFIMSELLINYGFVDFLGEIFKNIMSKIFYLPSSAAFVIFGSMISGFPSSSKYIKDLLDKNLISIDDANYLLMFTHFSNPLFIIGTIGIMLLNNKKIGFIILISHILGNLIIALIYRKKKRIENSTVSLRHALNSIHKKRVSNPSFIKTLSTSILNSFNTLILILGIVATFIIIITILNNIFSFNLVAKGIISGILEMTGGIKNICSINLPLIYKATISTMFISFGGISVHSQVLSILSDYNIKYKQFLKARILHALISGMLVYIVLIYSHNIIF